MDKQVYLRSLGNASLEQNVPIAAKFAEDPNVTGLLIDQHRKGGEVGSVAASALRKLLDQQISADTRYRISQALGE